MYAKIYKEVFIKGYTLKKQVQENIWTVKINNENFNLYIYNDTEEVEGFKQFNEAELLEAKKIKNTLTRIKMNKDFLHKIKTCHKENSYLFRGQNEKQGSLFSYDTYCY